MKMKKWIMLGVIILTFGLTIPASAWIYVGPLGDTGWQTFTYTAGPSGFTGTAGFVVSNQGDDLFDSWLLLDNLSHAGDLDNKGFEKGNYTGYNLFGSSAGYVIEGPITAYSGIQYYPADVYMSWQWSYNEDTSSFINMFGQQGTIGSILETSIVLGSKESFTFNWAFITWDEPFGDVGYDFALFYLKDSSSGEIIYTAGLAQVVPIPTTLLLLGSGLLGLVGIKLRKRVKI